MRPTYKIPRDRPRKPCSECGESFQRTMFESPSHFDKRMTCGKYACVQARTRQRQREYMQRRASRPSA